jgi:hypothetical protein
MNRYHRGSSTIVASRLGLAHAGAQLKVENPVLLRTILNFDLLPSPRASYCCRATLIYPEALIKNQNSAIPVPVATRTLHAKRAPSTGGKGFIDENGGGPGVRARKRQQKKARIVHQAARGRTRP